ncbi:retrovirus-related pol polyprotein from transposon TNT 1-94 [Tanacetum coccineum]
MGHFVRECRAPRNKDGQFSSRNQESLTRTVNIEDTFSKAMLAIDGVGFDWSDIAEEQIQTNMALIAFSDSEVYNDKTCSKNCLKNYETLKKQCDDLIVKLNETEFKDATYKRVLKREVGCKDYEIGVLKAEYEKVKQEKEGLDEFKEPEFNRYGPRDIVLKSTIECDKKFENSMENTDDSLEKEQVSDNENSSVESSPSVVKETVFHAAKKVEFIKPKNNEKPDKKTVSFDHMKINCPRHQRKRMVIGNNYNKVDYDYYAKTSHPTTYKNMTPRAVLLKTCLKPLSTTRPIHTAHPKPTVHSAKPMSRFSKQAQSTVQRPFYKKPTLTNRYLNHKVNTVRPRVVNTVRPYIAPVNTVRANGVNDVKPSACWVWRPTRPNGASLVFNRYKYIDARGYLHLNDKGFVDSGCSRHMTGNIAYLSNYKEFDGGRVTFGGGAYGGRISGKGTLKTNSLDFDDVYFVKKLNFNLFSVSRMCDKKNCVLFTDTECLVLSPDFKLPDESQILLKIPRKDNMYSFDMKNIVPKESLTCLAAKATLDESMLWHRRLVIMESLVKKKQKVVILELKRRHLKKYSVLTNHLIRRIHQLDMAYPPVGYGVSNLLIRTSYGVLLSLDNTVWCMTRSSTKELLSPLENPERVLRSRRKLFDNPSLVETNSPKSDQLSEIEEHLEKEEVTEIMAETMEQYMSKTRENYGSGVTRPTINQDTPFELKGQFLKELRDNTFSGSENEDANEHIEKVLEIVDLFHIPKVTQDQIMLRAFPVSLTGAANKWLRSQPSGLITTWEILKTKFLNKYCPPARTARKMEEINNFQQEPDESLFRACERFKELLMNCPQHYLTDMQEVILFYNGLDVPTRQILDSKGAISSKTAADAKIAIQKMAEYSQKWHNETSSRARGTETSDGLAAIQAQLNNLEREIKKVNEKVYATQVGCEQCKGPQYTKDCPQKEEGKTLEEAYYTQFGAPYQPGGQYRATGPGFYQCNNRNSSYPTRRETVEESLAKFMAESAKRHEENSNIIKEIRASTDAAIQNQGASIKTLELQIGQMSKVLQERGFESLPSSTETNPKDHVKSVSTATADLSKICRMEHNPYAVSGPRHRFMFPKTVPFPRRLHKYYYDDLKEAHGVNILDAYDSILPQIEKDLGSFTLPCLIDNICFNKGLVDLGSSVSVMPFSTYSNLGLVIMESLVKKKQKGTILELKRRHLKKVQNCINTSYPEGRYGVSAPAHHKNAY